MSYRLFGLSSMIFFTIAVLLALAVVARASLWWAGGFILLNIAATLVIGWSYCAKCACRAHRCSHFLVGKVADLLPKRPRTPYTAGDYLGMLLASAAVFAYPLYWLWKQPTMLIAFFSAGALGAGMMLLWPSARNARIAAARRRDGNER